MTTKRKTGGADRGLRLILNGKPVASIADSALDYPEAPALILRAIGAAIEELHAARSAADLASKAGGHS